MPDDAQPVFISLPERIGAWARQRPEHTALAHGPRKVSYAGLDRAMDRVAATLQARGLKAQDSVAISAARSID